MAEDPKPTVDRSGTGIAASPAAREPLTARETTAQRREGTRRSERRVKAKKETGEAKDAAKKAVESGDPKDAEMARQEAADEGVDLEDSELAGQLGQLGAVLPSWISRIAGNSIMGPEVVSKLMEQHNLLNPFAPVTNAKELYEKLAAPTPQNQWVATLALSPEAQGVLEEAYDLGPAFGNKRVHIQNGAAARDLFGETAARLPVIAGTADINGVPWQLVIAAAEGASSFKPGRVDYAGETLEDQLDAADGNRSIKERLGRNDVDSIAKQLSMNMQRFGDYSLALIATKHEGLAMKLHSGQALSKDEQLQVKQLFLDANYSEKNMAALGLVIDSEKFAYINEQAGGGETVKVALPGEDDMKTAVETLYRGWFQMAPDDATLQQLVGKVAAVMTQEGVAAAGGGAGGASNPFQRAAATGGGVRIVEQPSELGAVAARAMREDPRYSQLMGNKPGNLDEGQWAQQNQRAVTGVLGAQGLESASSIQAGMMSGSSSTATGAAALSGAAANNSTFQERLAQAAQVVARMT